MGKRTYRLYGFVAALVLTLCMGLAGRALAASSQSSSSHFSVNEVQIGGAGSGTGCSTSLCAKQSVGDTVVGRGSSTDYSAQFGSNTTGEPLLEVAVEGGSQNMGVLDSDITGTASSVVRVRSYLTNGYTLYVSGPSPSQGVHRLATMAPGPGLCPCTSQPGTEQFGINLRQNTTPLVGADPVQVPSAEFAGGAPYEDYDQQQLFTYENGAPVAGSSRSGETDYTLSMIMNVSNVTPGGKYSGVFSAVVAPGF